MRSLSIERWISWLLGGITLVLLLVQMSSLYVTPIHDSYLWWGDESWLMNEYHSQITSGIFRHPFAYGSTIWIGNPFPFTSMWLTSAIYGAASLAVASVHYVDVGRTVTAFLSVILLMIIWRRGKSIALSNLSLTAAVALLVSCRSFLLTSHSARYDILSALALLVLLGKLIRELQSRRIGVTDGRMFKLGILWGSSLIVSAHVPLLLTLPILYLLIAQRVRFLGWIKLLIGAAISFGALYLLHLLLQPVLSGETNLSENLRTIPILRPFSWSVQSSNLAQKWELVVRFAPQLIVMLLACFIGLASRALTGQSKQTIILLLLPTIGWLLFQPAGPSSYLIHFLPALALAAAIGIETLLFGNVQRFAIGFVGLLCLVMGVRDAIIAKEVGSTLTIEHRSALSQVEQLTSTSVIIAMNPAQSYLLASPATTHFIELPNRMAKVLEGNGYLLTYNSSLQRGFMWEVTPLRKEITKPELVLTGHYLDVGRSYFAPLDRRLDTLFLQRVDLNALYKRHIR